MVDVRLCISLNGIAPGDTVVPYIPSAQFRVSIHKPYLIRLLSVKSLGLYRLYADTVLIFIHIFVYSSLDLDETWQMDDGSGKNNHVEISAK